MFYLYGIKNAKPFTPNCKFGAGAVQIISPPQTYKHKPNNVLRLDSEWLTGTAVCLFIII